MSTWNTQKVDGYSAVVLRGGAAAVEEAAALFRTAGFIVSLASPRSLVLQDVRDQKLPQIHEVAGQLQLQVSCLDRNQYLTRTRQNVRKAFKLSVQPNRWYFAEQLEETFPLVFVREVKIEKISEVGDEVQLLTLELHSGDSALPTKQVISSNDAAQYGLRPATAEDFEKFGLIPPEAQQLTASYCGEVWDPELLRHVRLT